VSLAGLAYGQFGVPHIGRFEGNFQQLAIRTVA